MKMVFQPSIFRYELLVSGGNKSCNLQSLCYCFIQDSYPSRELTYATPKRHPMTLKPLNLQTQIPPRLMLQTMATTLSLIKCHLYTNFWCFRVPSWFHWLFPGKSCANIILDLQVTKTPTDTGSYIRIMSTIFLLKWCHWQKRKGFSCWKKQQPEKKKHVWEMEAYTGETVSSTILEGSNMESTFALTFPCQRWRQKHTHSRHLNSLTDWKSLLVFTFKWLSLNSNKGCSFSTRIGHFASQGPLPNNPTCSSSWSPWQPPASKRGENLHADFERGTNVWSAMAYLPI